MEMPKLNEKTFREVKKLVRKSCCNCYDDNCLLLDDGENHSCPQLITYSHIICRYFLNSVLPFNKSLFSRIREPTKTKMMICRKCGRQTVRTGRNQKFCSDCAKDEQRRRNAEFMAKKRNRRGCY